MKLSGKILILFIADISAVLFSYIGSTYFFTLVPMERAITFSLSGAISFSLLGYLLGSYRTINSHMAAKNEFMLALVALLSTGLTFALFNQDEFDKVPILASVLFTVTLLPRLVARAFYQSQDNGKRRIAIYGAGEIGLQLASALEHSGEQYLALFFDDDPNVQGRALMGRPVLRPTDIPNKLAKYKVSEIYLALPGVNQTRRREIIESLRPSKIRLRTVPTLTDIFTSRFKVDDLQEIDLEELLSRTEVEPLTELIAASVKDKVVLVTGAGGSIGSELCRQVAATRPRQLVMFEQCEHNLYQIDQEIRSLHSDWSETMLVTLLGNVCDPVSVNSTLAKYNVDIIFHAAAYKHVPLVECNPLAAIQNNVLGTHVLANSALKFGVPQMVLISTDKAVRPTNVMGATKRLAEQILQGLSASQLGTASKRTHFSIVRFGNVLGSSGSVVPLFRKQILEGGPVTVTHPEVTRFIMTIPEAVQLVLQASSLAENGDICVLDMGKPVKIQDLARQLIHLSGLSIKDKQNPEGDIEIRYIGLRPGEKLFEELFLGSDVHVTIHPKVMRVRESFAPLSSLNILLAELEQAVRERDESTMYRILAETVDGYPFLKDKSL